MGPTEEKIGILSDRDRYLFDRALLYEIKGKLEKLEKQLKLVMDRLLVEPKFVEAHWELQEKETK